MDQALEVVEQYQGTILKLERDVLVRPNMKTVTARTWVYATVISHTHRAAVHMLQGDLNMHKRTLEPIKTLVYGLRRYDVDRAAAILANEGKVWDAAARPVGFMSEKSKTYLVSLCSCYTYKLRSDNAYAGGRPRPYGVYTHEPGHVCRGQRQPHQLHV